METIKLLKKDYINPEENMHIEDRINFLMAVWKDIIIKHSNENFINLKDNQKNALIEASKEFNFEHLIKDNIVIGELDKIVVNNILLMAVKTKKQNIVNIIYKRIKYAIPRYFYGFELMDAYIKLLNIDKAKEILNYMISKHQKAYWYMIIYFNKDIYKQYPEIYKEFREKQYECYARLLQSGETLNLNLNLQVIDGIKKYI